MNKFKFYCIRCGDKFLHSEEGGYAYLSDNIKYNDFLTKDKAKSFLKLLDEHNGWKNLGFFEKPKCKIFGVSFNLTEV